MLNAHAAPFTPLPERSLPATQNGSAYQGWTAHAVSPPRKVTRKVDATRLARDCDVIPSPTASAKARLYDINTRTQHGGAHWAA